MDIIFIHQLPVETIIGVYPQERERCRTLLLDLELGTDIRPAAASDRLEETIDYQALARRIRDVAATTEFRLVEALAERIADLVLREFAVPWLRLTLHKPGVPSSAKAAGVIIERGGRPLA